ncbi:P-loop NTPase fold protein [Aliidiomarina iranensis]
MNDISKHIRHLLSDSSFPPLVMLDGDWGEGKTYFTKNTLIPELTAVGESCVLFSLTGLASINDFKNRLLSATYIKKQVDAESGKSMSTLFASLASQFGGEKGGAIASMLSGASGLVKEVMLSKLSDKIIIIDDLDRVKGKRLCDLIIGECLQLSDNSNLKFIFIVNDKKVSGDLALKEKVFSGCIKLNKSLQESVEIGFSGYNWFEEYREKIVKAVEQQNLKNLRILKRTSKKLDEIFRVLKLDKSLDLERSMSQMIIAATLVTFYHYEKGLSESDIWERSEYSNFLPGERDEKYEYGDLVEIRSFLTKELISYLVGGSNWHISISDFGRLPQKGCPIDAFIFSPHFHHDDESFERNVDILQAFVFEDTDVSFSKWFEAAYFYHFLQSNQFFTDERPILSEIFDDLYERKNFDYSDLDGRANRLRIDPKVSFIFEKHMKACDAYKERRDSESQIDTFEQMRKSWQDVDIKIYKSHQIRTFFNQFSVEQLMECIDGWKTNDILLFSDFISERYKSINIRTYLSDELQITSELLVKVQARFEEEPAGRKKGALGFLRHNLSSAVKALSPDDERNLKQ